MLKVTQVDARRCTEFVKVLSRMKIEVEGAEEILALAQVVQWAGELGGRIRKVCDEQAMADKAKVDAALAAFEAKPTNEAAVAPKPAEMVFPLGGSRKAKQRAK
jgi:hypothetical protein